LAETLSIARQFRGPPNSGNGGYVCGLVGQFIDGPAESTLRAPPPLETPLNVVRDGAGVRLMHRDALIAEARPSQPTVIPPASPGVEAAERASRNYLGFKDHLFHSCFVCGTSRTAGDGLRLFPGPVRDGMVACAWTPSAAFADGEGRVADLFLWAALDCPSYWSLPSAGVTRAVLGRLTAEITARPRADQTLVVAAWPLSSSARKHRAATAIYDADGAVLARAEAMWIDIKPEQFT
jgi:hypothetical protein